MFLKSLRTLQLCPGAGDAGGQAVQFGDDAALFGERGKWNNKVR
ncbi:hypothetical protein KBA01_21430 [Kozakia baliensis]|nr:hypothetical protein KBA01_21430 [Kozakia baliensis]